VKFLQLSFFVIFVLDELTVSGFARREFEKTLRTGALEQSSVWALLSSFCDDSNLHMSLFK